MWWSQQQRRPKVFQMRTTTFVFRTWETATLENPSFLIIIAGIIRFVPWMLALIPKDALSLLHQMTEQQLQGSSFGPAKKQRFQQGSLINPGQCYQKMTTVKLRTSEPSHEPKPRSDESKKTLTRDPFLWVSQLSAFVSSSYTAWRGKVTANSTEEEKQFWLCLSHKQLCQCTSTWSNSQQTWAFTDKSPLHWHFTGSFTRAHSPKAVTSHSN